MVRRLERGTKQSNGPHTPSCKPYESVSVPLTIPTHLWYGVSVLDVSLELLENYAKTIRRMNRVLDLVDWKPVASSKAR